MKKSLSALVGIALLAVAGSAVALTTGERNPNRADCPGLIVCPLTGEKICADKCPLTKQTDGEAKKPCPNCRK